MRNVETTVEKRGFVINKCQFVYWFIVYNLIRQLVREFGINGM